MPVEIVEAGAERAVIVLRECPLGFEDAGISYTCRASMSIDT